MALNQINRLLWIVDTIHRYRKITFEELNVLWKEKEEIYLAAMKKAGAEEFINDEEIRETLAYAEANKNNAELIDRILEEWGVFHCPRGSYG